MNRFEEQHQFEQTQRMLSRLGAAFGKRRYPRVRGVKGRSGLWVRLAYRRTRRAAFRAARKLRDTYGEQRPLVVFPLPKEKGRKTCDWAVATRRTR